MESSSPAIARTVAPRSSPCRATIWNDCSSGREVQREHGGNPRNRLDGAIFALTSGAGRVYAVHLDRGAAGEWGHTAARGGKMNWNAARRSVGAGVALALLTILEPTQPAEAFNGCTVTPSTGC